ncbi:MAG TPA: hypothetical protein VIU61_28835 [Kofleriaceae bacterium]
MTRATGLVALAACATVPEPPPELGDDVVTVAYQNGGVQVRGPITEGGVPLYEMTFPDTSDEIGMPDSFKIGGRETLSLPPDDCNRERRIGVALFPAGVVTSGDIASFGGESNVETIVEAPGLAKVRVTYDIDYQCPTLQTFSGESIFTFFPSGRIVREDIEISPSSSTIDPQGANFACGCGFTDIPFYFTSFWSFDANGSDEQVDANNMEPRDGITSQACTMYPTHGVGVAWPDASTRFHPSVASTHVYDFLANQQSIPEGESGSVTSAVQVHDGVRTPGTCGNMLAQLADPRLLVGDEQLGSTDHDGIYRPSEEHDDTTVLTTDDGIPGSWAISINLGGATHGRVTRSPPLDDFVRFHADPESEGNTVFVFLQGLAPGESITIEPL